MKNKKQALVERYGTKNIPSDIFWNDQIALLLSHRSVRKYLPNPLPKGTLETMVAAAQSASNSSNLNQWTVIAVTDPIVKSEVAKASRHGSVQGNGNPYIDEAPVCLIWIADMSRNKTLALSVTTEKSNGDYLDSVLMASIDTAIAAQNAVLAAESMGLGIVYIGGLRNNEKEIAKILGLPKYSYIAFGMCVGYPDLNQASAIRPRLPQKAVLHYNEYCKTALLDHVNSYEETFQGFRTSQNMIPKTWADSIRFAMTSMDWMDGRENLKKILIERGFKLL